MLQLCWPLGRNQNFMSTNVIREVMCRPAACTLRMRRRKQLGFDVIPLKKFPGGHCRAPAVVQWEEPCKQLSGK